MIRTKTHRLSRSTAGRLSMLAGASLLSLMLATPAWAGPDGPTATALPNGGQVVAGQATIGSNGPAMTVTQTSDRGIINWQSFDIGTDASVTFLQPNANAVTLNRVLSGGSSTIAGKLSANGKVYVVNPNGVLFTSTAQVDVGGLVAAAGDIADSDFLAGRDRFTVSAVGSVINQGRITARDGGQVVLVGGTVSNFGAISAARGDIVLAAGSKVVLDAGADGHLKVEVDDSTSRALVQNGGLIAAGGGQILLTAQGAGAALSSIVSNTGTIEARTLSNQSGKILLLAGMESGLVQAGGMLDASAPDGGNGGFVETSAASLGFAPDLVVSTLASSGKTGTWLIDPYNITVSTSGSSNVSIDFGSNPSQVLPLGSGGNINNATLSSYLGTTNVALRTIGAGNEAGNVTINAPVSWNAATTLTLAADATTGGVFLNAALTGSNANSGVVLSAGTGGINQTSGGIISAGTLSASTTNGGAVALNVADNQIAQLAASSSAGNFSLGNGRDLVVNGPVTSGTGNVSIVTAGDLTVDAAMSSSLSNAMFRLQSSGGALTLAKDLTLSGDNALLILTSANGYTLTNGARLTLSGASAGLTINSDTYTVIESLAQLQAIGTSGYYALGIDIDAAASAGWNGGAGFAPIASFNGTFAGLGHTIDRLTINRPGQAMVGLFGSADSSVLRDFTLSNVRISGAARVGAVGGTISNSTMTNLHVTGQVSAGQEAGGIAGWLGDSHLAGISSSATVTAVANGAGGLVGRLFYSGDIADSYATGSVTGATNVGGLIGEMFDVTPLNLTNVYASGRVSGASTTGGLIGDLGNSVVNASGAYWDTNSTGQSTSPAGTGITNANAFTQSTYSGFDFTTAWVMIAGQTRPMLRSEASSVITTPHAMQLAYLGLSGAYTLGADLDFTPAFTASGGYYGDVWGNAGFVPLGTNSTPFTGSLSGGGHSITGLVINRSGSDYVGLVGFGSGATITGIKLLGGSVTGNDNVGALAGYLQGGSVSSASASATVSAVSTGESNVGGLIGTNDGGAIADSSASGAVTGAGYQAGGLVGYNANGGTITRSYATGSVTGTSTSFGYIGGLVGANGYTGGDGGVISQSYATGAVVAAAGPVGGFAGHNEGSITDSYATGSVTLTGAGNAGGFVGVNFIDGTINAAYSTGAVSGTGAGGFIGYNNSGNGSITNAYWNVQTSGKSVGVFGGTATGVTGRTTAQLQGSLPAGFSSAVWNTGTNLYPYFGWRYSTTPVAVSGFATSSFGGGALVGATVTAVSNGTAIGSAETGQNGYYYILSAASALGTSGVLAYLDNGATQGAGVSDVAGVNGVQNVDIYGSAVRLRTDDATLVATRADYLAIRGSYTDSDLSFLSASSFAPLTASGYGVYLVTPASYTLNASLGSGGTLVVGGASTLAVSGAIGLTANGPLTINAPFAWSDASGLTLNTTGGGAITLGGAVTAPNGTLTIAGSGGVSDSSTVNVNTFALTGGSWSQIGVLPAFSAVNFRLTPTASFIRAISGDGSTATPYLIADVYGLQGMASYGLLSSHFGLANDIDASGTAAWNSLAGFLPIGTSANSFTGSFDGQGRAITGLSINRSTPYTGLFGYSSGTIRNLALTGVVTGSSQTGGLIGYMAGGSVTSVQAHVTVNGASSAQAGGLVGYQAAGTISRSSASGDVSGVGSAVGGLVGQQDGGSIDQSFASGAVSATLNNAGGLVGIGGGGISNSYATGNVTVQTQGGGLVGYLNGGTILNSYATGTVSGTSLLGGLVGYNSGTITASFWNTSSSGRSIGVGGGTLGGATGVTATGIELLATFAAAGWDIDDAGGTGKIWRIYDGNTAPLLRTFLTPLTVTGGAVSRSYNGFATSAAGALTYGSLPDFSQLFGTAGYLASSPDAGTYSGASLALTGLYSTQAGYDISGTGTLTINPVPLTVTVSGATKTYDGLAYSGGNGISYTGFVNGEGAGVLGGSLVYGGAAQGAINAGTYGLTASGLTSGNYAISYVGGSLVVNPAALTVTVNGATKTYDGLAYGGGNGVSYTGFVNGEGAGILGGSLVYGGTAQGAVNAGTYGLTASGLTSGNYAISYVSGSLVVNPAALTVTVNGATKTYDGLAYSGGNGVSYAGFVNGEGSGVLGGSLVYGGTAQGAINAGTYGLTASGLTSGNYAISYVGGSLVVNPAALTVTVNGATKTYDGLAYSGGNGVSYTGFVNGEGSGVLGGSLVYGGTAQGAINAGTYGLTASGLTSGNYAISYVGGSLVVNPAALTVTVNGATKTYDGLAYSGGNGVTYAGFVNGEGAGVLGGSLVYGGAAQGAINAGTYGLTASGLTSGNYAISYVGGSLVVNPAALTVTVNGATKTYDGLAYGGGNGVSYTGFVNGEGSGVLGGSLVYGGTAQGAINAGTYGLTASGLTSGNYAISYVGGSLVVNPAALTVTVSGATKTYDGLAYSGGNGVSYTGFVNGEGSGVLGGTLVYGGTAQGAVNAGTYGLTASGLTSGNYAISYVGGSLVVNPAALTVSVNGATKTYDGLAYGGGNGVSYTGFVNGEGAGILGGSLVYGGAAQGAINSGTYGLTASGLTSGNYAISYVGGALVVNSAALTVTVNGATKTYDGLAYSGGNGVTYAGFVNGEGAGVLGGSLVYGGTAQGAINSGTYGLTASGLTSGNYAISYVGGALVVNPAALAVVANSISIPLFGDYLPLTYTVSGLVPRDASATILTGALATNVNTGLPGNYTITQGSLAITGGNYIFSRFTPGILTVERPMDAPDGGFLIRTLPIEILSGLETRPVPGATSWWVDAALPAAQPKSRAGIPLVYQTDFIR